jgi:hypothetical protein
MLEASRGTMMETFKLEVPAYGHGRSISEAPYQWVGGRLLTVFDQFISTNWGNHSSSRGVIYGHFNELASARAQLWTREMEPFVAETIPRLKAIRDELFSEEGLNSSMASHRDRERFSEEFDGYLSALTLELSRVHWLALRVQEHFKLFAGDLDSSWQRTRRLDPNQPMMDTRLFEQLAKLRDLVFESPGAKSVSDYLAEVERLKSGDYPTILSYVQNQERLVNKLHDYDPQVIDTLEDELSVEALWLEQSHG